MASRPVIQIERSNSSDSTKADNLSPIRSFYRRKSVLITSPHEFWAKFLIFKLLQTCEPMYIFVLFRPKKNKSLNEMFDEYIHCDFFNHLRDSELLDKVIPIAAFPTLPALGLDDRDLKLLLANVSVIFHSTDTSEAKLNRTLKSAANQHINVTRNVVEFASKVHHLQSFVYMSTLNAAHTGVVNGHVNEEVYPLKPYYYKLDATTFWDKIKDLNVKYVEKIKPTFVGKHPNTYSFSISLAENLIWDNRASLKRAAIVRPSCLSASYAEPEYGFFENMQLPTSIMTLHAMGITRAVNEDSKKVLPLIPSDMLVNGMLAIGWYMGTQAPTNDCLIYNISSDEENGVTVEHIQRLATECFYKYPSTKAIRTPVSPTVQHPIVYRFNQIVSELLFAYFFDFLLICTGKSPMLVEMMTKMQESLKEVSGYYFRSTYNFTVSNIKQVISNMTEEDKCTFNCDVRRVNWSQHFDDCYMRFRRHVLHEPDSNVSDAIKRVHQLTKVYNTIKFVLIASLGLLISASTYYIARSVF